MWGRVVTLMPFGLQMGTPPRVWGRDCHTAFKPCSPGDTPTCVGKRPAKQTAKPTSKGHPHVCGEEDPQLRKAPIERGTPPRVWGREMAAFSKPRSFRDTPTCVGKRWASRIPIWPLQGHPHVCGERGELVGYQFGLSRDTPRVWGRDVFT